MAGFNADTLQLLDGFEHVQQSLEAILTTPQGSRVIREWVGNPGLRLLGENMTEDTILLWFTICYTLIEVYEPRFRIIQFQVDDLDRAGFAEFTMIGEYRPYAHLDWQQANVFVSVRDGAVTISNAR